MKLFTYICVLLLLLLGICFSLLNASSVTVNYFLGSSTLPVFVLIILSIAIGALLSWFFCLFRSFRQKADLRHLKKRLAIQEEELATLKINSRE